MTVAYLSSKGHRTLSTAAIGDGCIHEAGGSGLLYSARRSGLMAMEGIEEDGKKGMRAATPGLSNGVQDLWHPLKYV